MTQNKENKLKEIKELEIQEMLDKQPEEIEKAYPEAYRLAWLFHELYEENAPMFGYITNEKTREFDPSSKNGRLMAYVCYNIVQDEKQKSYLAGVEEVVKVIKDTEGVYCKEHGIICDHDVDIDKIRAEFLKNLEKLKQK